MKFMDFVERYGQLGVIHSSEVVGLVARPDVFRVQLNQWKEKGYLVPLKRGVYLVSQRFLKHEVPLFYISNELIFPSYVSLESAMAFYGLIPEGVFRGVVAVTTRKTETFYNKVGVFHYHHVKPSLFMGFRMVNIDGFTVKIASPEKSLLDYFYLRKIEEREMEGLRLQNLEIVNLAELESLSLSYPMRVQKIVRRLKNEIPSFTGS